MGKKVFAVMVALMIYSSISLADETAYYIGPGDVLEISVWRDESLTRKVVVPPDGMIAFPLIGDIDVSRMTVSKLRETIAGKLSEFVPDATVTVMLSEINSLSAYVIGKVNKPGVFPIRLDTSVMQVLSMAQGLNSFASAGKIHVLRKGKDKTVKIPFDYKEVLNGENLDQNIFLKAGDVVVVP
jgi:polysaccharide biosynthesis/export protein